MKPPRRPSDNHEPNRPVLRSARTVAEYIAIIDELSPTTSAGLWFRGQSNCSHRLTPGALRDVEQLTDALGQSIKPGQFIRSDGWHASGPSPERMLAAFKRQARPFLEISPSNDFEWMFIAQHHGLKTRLLDWSTNALAALFFAASGAPADDVQGAKKRGRTACREYEDGDEFRSDGFAVFVIDPGEINQIAGNGQDPIDVAAAPKDWAHYLDPMAADISAYTPICIVAPHVASRIRAQSGAFTLHGSNVQPLDYYTVLRPKIVKIFVPYTATKMVTRGLSRLGVDNSFIYPGLDSIARDVNATERDHYRFNRAKQDGLDDT